MPLDTTAPSSRLDAVLPILASEAQAGEEARRLTDTAHEALVASGVFNLFRPRSLGGDEADLLTMVRTVRALSRADGSAGWCAMISGAYSLLGGLMPRRGAEQVYANPVAILAGALSPGGQAVRVDGGYRVSGRWGFGSNCQHAEWLLGGVIVMEDGKPVMAAGDRPLIKLGFFRSQEATIIDTWRTTGLRGTGSHDYACKDVFVPEEMTFWFGDEPVEPGPLYRLPTIAAYGAVIASVTLGVADHMLDLFLALAPTKKPIMSPLTLQEKASVHDRLGVAVATIEAAGAYLERAVTDAWAIAEAGRRPTSRERGGLWLASTHASQTALAAIDSLYTMAGASSVYEANLLDRCLRDARTASQHVMTQFVNYETAGKERLGLSVVDSQWSFDRRPGDPA